ncbi:MacS family sensor histidine kinase [Kitasatospora nipponensis]
MSVELPLWRAISWFRVLALAYALARYAAAYQHFRHPVSGWIYLGALVVWTLATLRAFGGPARCTWPVLAVDLLMSVTGVVMSGMIDTPERIAHGAATLPTIWAAGSVLGCAGKGGWRPAAVCGLVIGAANIAGHGGFTVDSVHNIVLLMVTGCAIGYVIELARASEATLTQALQVEAATRERERLSRDIHDGVLQVLALVQRQAGPLDGELGALGRLAGEQERALRSLMTGAGPGPAAGPGAGRTAAGWTGPGWTGPGGSVPGAALPRQRDAAPGAAAAERVDLRALLARHTAERVTLSAPATPVELPAATAGELAAAVGAALDNVRRHAGPTARAWILLEDEPQAVTVSVRDDGPGCPAGRLEQARGEGRLGVTQSIQGRLRDLGGSAEVFSRPGEGVEVEMRVPREGL